MSNHSGMCRKGELRGRNLAILAMVLILAGAGLSGFAATFIVNDTGDLGDANPGDGVAEIFPGTGITTLRAAIEEANALPGPDTILFNVSDPITILTPLPAFTDILGGTTLVGGQVVTINGTIVDEGDPADPDDDTLIITPLAFSMISPNNVVRGVTISGFGVGVRITGTQNTLLNSTVEFSSGNGVEVFGADNTVANTQVTLSGENGILLSGDGAVSNTIRGSVIGGPIGGNSGMGIDIVAGANNNLVGGVEATARNVIAANGMYGIRIQGPGSSANVIQGNFIGLDAAGAAADPNGLDGILIFDGAANNVVGPTNANIIADEIDAAANVISGNTFSGITLDTADTVANIVRGNLIGVDPAGTTGIPNGAHGVHILGGAALNIIGHMSAGNVIAANAMYGVRIADPGSDENRILGNFIGTSFDSAAGIGNGMSGVLVINGAQLNRIGGITAGHGNVISGNNFLGVDIEGLGTNFNIVLGNKIGTTVDGLAALGNRTGGVRVWQGAKLNQIGAEPFGSQNIISGNQFRGVEITGAGTNENQVQGNYIGPDITGLAPIGNNGVGVSISNGAMSTLVGGLLRRERNIISGNEVAGLVITSTNTTQTRVFNNYIGLDATGQVPMPNRDSGIVVDSGASLNQIGGTAVGARNVISSNIEDGIQLSGPGTTANVIIGNYIGLNNLGEPGFGNTDNGVSIVNGAAGNRVGGAAPGAGNVISSNLAHGIEARGIDTINAQFHRNSIFGNRGQGIRLANNANQSIQPPVFDTLLPLSGTTFADATIEIFVDSEDEGEIFLGAIAADEDGEFSASLDLLAHLGKNLTATVTDGGTSEFSFPIPIAPPVFLEEPADLVVVVGESAVFSVTVAGAQPLTYRWHYWDGADPENPVFVNLFNGSNHTGTDTDTLTILSANFGNAGVYRCRVTNPFGTNDSRGATLTVFPNFSETAVITTLDDVADGDTGSLAQLIARPGADGRISLREAILAANNTAGPVTLSIDPALVADGPGTAIIQLASALPSILGDGLTLDGSGILLLGSALGGNANGLEIRSANNHLSGLSLLDFPGSGVYIAGGSATNNSLQNCILAGNGVDGVRLASGAASNLLGGTTEGEELLLIANSGAGIRLTGAGTTGNQVLGCLIGGGTVEGADILAGNLYGVQIDSGASGNRIGSVDPGAGNTIVANTEAGVRIQNPGSDNNLLQGNQIGQLAEGTPAGNGFGVYILAGSSGNLVGGTEIGAANTIAHNFGTGILISDTPSVRNQIRRNSIFSNGGDGINIRNLANNGIQPPVITGLGSVNGTAAPGATVELFLDAQDEGETYLDTVLAGSDGSFSSTADVSGALDKRVTATATDSSGNTSRFSAAFPIDQIPPVITLLGAATITLECVSGVYQEPGATALDTVDGDVSADIVTRFWLDGIEVAAIDTSSAPLTYTVTYDVADRAGNAANQVIRTVNVVDTGAPLITIIGSARFVVALGGTYIDAGATAADLCEGNLTASIVTNNPVNTNAVGDYIVTYDVTDSAGNAATRRQRTVSVLESIGVTLTLNGPTTVATECGMPYVDAGATAFDQQGNDISDRIEVSGTVDTSMVGTSFLLFYNATDASGNPAATIIRTVQVVDTAGPSISLIGGNVVEATCFSFYQDAGAVALDACEGDLSAALTMTSTVDTTTPGTYTVRYTAADSRGNSTTAVRTVVVLDCNTECELQCANEENPVDNDGDGLSACVEACLGTSDNNPDSDGDGMPDGWEVAHGLDPLAPDADGDLDMDGSSNLDEFLEGSHPGDPHSAKRTVWVGPNGTDAVTSGAIHQPYATIAYALERIFNPNLNPTRIVAFAGSYPGDLALVPNVSIVGALGQSVEIAGAIQGAENTELINLEVLGDTGDEVLLNMDGVTMLVRGVLFQGSSARPGVGILASGGAPGESVIEGCAFISLNTGIEIQGATPLIRDCHFAEMSVAGVVFQSGANVGNQANGQFGDTGTGWNVFDLASLDGPAVINMNAATAVMEINDWSSDNADVIAARLQGPVDFVPFLGAGSGGLAATVYVTVWDAQTQERIENARVTLLGEEFDSVQANRNGVYTFALVPGKEYVVEVKARRFQTRTIRFEVDAGQRRSLIVPLVPRKGGIVGCHADAEDAGTALGLLLPALLTGAFLLARSRSYRKRSSH